MQPFLEISLILGVATVVAFVMQRLRQPLILGHIITGVIVGPSFFNIVRSADTLAIFSKLGITALLFIVGLSLSPRVMREVGKTAFILGLGQVIFTSLFGFLICLALGFSNVPAAYIAMALTFSSTIIVSKLLADKKDLGKLYGKISIGMLLVQDVIASLLLIVLSSVSTGGGVANVLGLSIIRTLAMAAILFGVSRWLLPVLTSTFAKSQEFLLLFSIGWGVGLAALFSYLGLSMEIGALAAGVTLAASPYHYEISSKMKLLRDFFLILFFVLLGSQLNMQNIGPLILPATFLSLFVLIGNPLIVMAIMGWLGYHRKTGFLTGLSVAQISEFSLILMVFGQSMGHVSREAISLVTIVGLVTITISTLLFIFSEGLYRLLDPWLRLFERGDVKKESTAVEAFDVILFGCHRVGMDFLSVIKRLRKKYLVIDFDPDVIAGLKRQKIPCRYGDLEDSAFLDLLDLKRLKLVVSTVPDIESNLFLLSSVRKTNPRAVVIIVAQDISEATVLYDAGATYVVLPHFLGGNYASMLVEKHGFDVKQFSEERKKHLVHLRKRRLADPLRKA